MKYCKDQDIGRVDMKARWGGGRGRRVEGFACLAGERECVHV